MDSQTPQEMSNSLGQTKDEALLIAVMGSTGSGKSSFINAASGSQLNVGHGLKSCTSSIARSDVFTLAGRDIVLIDTPGFDDTTVSDIDVLKHMSGFLSITYEHGYKLSGIIYLHRISDNKVGGISRRNLTMFRKLCGEEALRNVAFITTMWDSFVDQEPAVVRERELANRNEFFRPMLQQGARMYRHTNSVDSAREIISNLIRNMSDPVPLQVQRELVERGVSISGTAAGMELLVQREALLKKHDADLQDAERDMRRVQKMRTTVLHQENEEVCRELREKIAKLRTECEQLEAEFVAKRKELWRKVDEARAALNSAREEHADTEKKLRELRDNLQRRVNDEGNAGRWVREGGMALLRLVDIVISIYSFVH
ncbi:P-loop containing nucleoside triphosphate hydrolase protein [Irpex rosettiformis]|uniref:P-loop containing nucleoside triphosphate hydrolase protein n=1 Tax=Irpex rosettiformis TaxID=378272 RepID=A0ACB8UA09_9APHY|nr:P-loop containing nucleoside triphosphate hydrolase protein [Irpex rosettiformis]